MPENNFPKTLLIEIAHTFGGSGTRLLTILRNSPKDKIGLACLKGSETAQRAREYGIKIYLVGNTKFDPFIFFRLREVITKEKFEIIDTQNINSKIWGALVAPWCKAAFVSTINSLYIKEFGKNLKGWVIKISEKITNFGVDLFISVSSEVKSELLKSGVSEGRVALILNSVNINPLEINDYRVEIIKKYNLSKDSIIGVSVGRLIWLKGFDILIDAIKHVLLVAPNFVCFILGNGPTYSVLSEKISKAGLEDRVILTGYLPLHEVYAYVKSSDMFIMPSRTEGSPMALLEAATLSRPIIASRVGGIPDMVTDGKQAILVEPENDILLAEAILKLIQNPEFSTKLGYQAKQKIDMEYHPEIQLEKLKNAYITALRNYRIKRNKKK